MLITGLIAAQKSINLQKIFRKPSKHFKKKHTRTVTIASAFFSSSWLYLKREIFWIKFEQFEIKM
jgi:hypothetical protein